MNLIEHIQCEIRETGLLTGYGRVIAAVSGGADSVFLFYVLLGLSENGDFGLSVLHVHHGIRGAEADRDAGFVRRLAREHGVPCEIVYRDVPALAAVSGRSVEEAGRDARYALFRARIRDGRSAVALAHHRDDQAETVLFRLARGTGLRGLAGMRADEHGIVRPLLSVGCDEIEACLREHGSTWCEDSTNGEDDAARNRIRHRILPLLKEDVNSGAARHIAEAAERLREAADFLDEECLRRSRLYLERRDGGALIGEGVLREPAAVRKGILRRALLELDAPLRDFGAVQYRDLEALFERENGRRIDLPNGARALKTAGGVLLFLSDSGPGESGEKGPRGRIFLEVTDEVPDPVPQKRYTKWLDYDKMNHKPQIRTRLPGDFMTVNAAGGRKSLSDYFTDEKVPPAERDRILLLADGQEIVWAAGMRIGYRYRVSESTRRVLVAEYRDAGDIESVNSESGSAYGQNQCDDTRG